MGTSEALQESLAQLQKGGRVDSSGSFTLDLTRSLEKLSQFQLENSRTYVHFLVAAAVCRGASYIQFEINSRDVLACFDGEPFRKEELADLFYTLFEGCPPERMARGGNHLGLALNATRQLGPQFVIFDSYPQNGGSGARLQLTETLLQVAPIALPRRKFAWHSRFHLREPVDTELIMRSLAGAASWWPEKDVLRNGRCGFCPIPIWVNGKTVEPPVEVVLEWWTSSSSCSRPDFVALEHQPLEQAMAGGIGLKRDETGKIYWVQDGLYFLEETPALPEEVCVWAYADHLQTDLSRTALAQNNELAGARKALLTLVSQRLPVLQSRMREHPRAAQKFIRFGSCRLL